MNAVLGTPAVMVPLDIVIPLQMPERPRVLLLCVHPGGLPNHAYRQLGKGLPDYAILSAELGMDLEYAQATHDSSDELIPKLANRIRSRLLELLGDMPDGTPVILGGWSFGGVIAFQIIADWPSGIQKPRLFMIDSIAPVKKIGQRNLGKRTVATWFVRFFNSLRGANLRVPNSRITSEEALISYFYKQAEAQNVLPRGTTEAGIRKLFRTFISGLEKNSRLTENYDAQPVDIDAVLLRATHGLLKRFYVFRAMGWRRLIKDLRIITLPGDHYSIMVRDDALALATAELARMGRKSEEIRQ